MGSTQVGGGINAGAGVGVMAGLGASVWGGGYGAEIGFRAAAREAEKAEVKGT